MESGEPPTLNVEGDLVALGPLRRDLLPLYTRWINDLATVRTLGASLPITLEGETKWYDEWATSEKTVPFTVYARQGLRPIGTASLFEVDHRNRTAVFGIFIGDGEYRGKATAPRPPASCSTTPSRCWVCTTSCSRSSTSTPPA